MSLILFICTRVSGKQRMDDLFPDNTNAITSAMRCLRLNADLSRLPHIPTRHTYPAAARLPRIMHIPLANKVSFPTRHVRLEFDHSTVDYYIEIDTVLLSSQVSPETIAAPISSKRAEIVDKHRCETPSRPSLTDLPLDVLLLIGSLLDLRSLMHLSATCRYLRDPCLHFSQFHSVNLQPYWNRLTNASLENFFQHRCVQTRYLSLSWSRSIGILPFNALLTACSDHLVQLNLACCQYLTGEHIQIVANTCRNLQILNLESCTSLSNIDFEPLSNLDQIRSLNLYRTHIDYRTLLPLINRNASHFEHINLGEPSNVYTLAIDDGCTLSHRKLSALDRHGGHRQAALRPLFSSSFGGSLACVHSDSECFLGLDGRRLRRRRRRRAADCKSRHRRAGRTRPDLFDGQYADCNGLDDAPDLLE